METGDISVFAKWTSFFHFMSFERNRWFLWECLTKCRDSTYARYWMFIQSHWQFWVAASCDLTLQHGMIRLWCYFLHSHNTREAGPEHGHKDFLSQVGMGHSTLTGNCSNHERLIMNPSSCIKRKRNCIPVFISSTAVVVCQPSGAQRKICCRVTPG